MKTANVSKMNLCMIKIFMGGGGGGERLELVDGAEGNSERCLKWSGEG